MASSDGIPRIPPRLHLLLSACDTTVETELAFLGLAARILESEPILTGPLLDPAGEWGPRSLMNSAKTR